MTAASSAASVPGVDPSEFYDPNVTQFPPRGAPNFAPVVTEDDREPRARRDYVAMLAATVDVLAARLLALIAVVGAVVMFIWTAYDPQPWRLYAAVAYAIVVVWPMVIMYLKKG